MIQQKTTIFFSLLQYLVVYLKALIFSLVGFLFGMIVGICMLATATDKLVRCEQRGNIFSCKKHVNTWVINIETNCIILCMQKPKKKQKSTCTSCISTGDHANYIAISQERS